MPMGWVLPGGATLSGDERTVACRPGAAVEVRTGRIKPPPPEKGLPTIFISYRRSDNAYAAGWIYAQLVARFGGGNVFMDVADLPLGRDFRKHLNQEVGKCHVLLAIIEDHWLDARHEEGPHKGQRRLDDPTDFVRIEIQAALTRDIPVIPVLVGKATMPREEDFPDVLKPLAYRHAAEVRSGGDFQAHVDRLIDGIGRAFRR
jgi:hypothetical protein